MNQKHQAISARIALVMSLLSISLFVSSCGAGQVFGPTLTPTSTLTPTTTPTLTPTLTPVPTLTSTPTITPVPTLAPDITDGEWTGQDSQNKTVKFVVKDKQITSFTFEELAAPNCIFGYDSNEEITPVVIEDGKFVSTLRILFAPSSNVLLGLQFGDLKVYGSFVTDTEAKGTAVLGDKDCGIKMTWTAEKTP